jgi:phosphoglycerate dehydrogenase-like enzyme
VAILDDYQGVALELADWTTVTARAEVDVHRQHFATEDQLVDALGPCEVVVAMRDRTPFPRSTLERLPNLRLLIETGTRTEVIDLEACRELGIDVRFNGEVPGGYASTVELTWALILAAVRHLPEEIANVRAGRWMSTMGTSLAGRTLGILGLGRLGAKVATVGRAFGMDVLAWSANLTQARCDEHDVTFAELDDLLGRSDIVSVHLVLSERTRGLIDESRLRRMKRSAWLVNTSRGPIVDERALLRACSEGWIAGAALDVYDQEPLPVDHPLRSRGNVVATPHIGYVAAEKYACWYREAVSMIGAYIERTAPR